MNTTPAAFVGIDVSKATLDVALRPSGERFSASNDEAGIRIVLDRLRPLTSALVVLEATGGFENATVAALATAGFQIVVANPRQIRDFARATGPLAKTDRIDADILALFADRVRPQPRPLPDEAAQALDALLTRRRQLLEMLTAEKNRLAMAPQWTRKDIRAVIHMLERQLKRIDDHLNDLIGQSPLWRQKRSFRACRGWALCSPGPSWRSCPNWGPSTAVRSPHWLVWPLSAATAGSSGDDE